LSKSINTSISKQIVLHLNKEKGMTLKKIGALMDVKESYISCVKNGTRDLTVASLMKLENSLGIALPCIFAEAIDLKSVSKKLRPQYNALRKVASKSEALGEALTSS